MKQCPKCQSAYPNDAERFCGRDGTQLVDLPEPAATLASLPVSPSEIVLLHGEQFAPTIEGGFFQTRMQVPISGAMVDAMQLAKMMLTAMVLATEQAGSIHLQIGPTSLMSLRSQRLLVSSGPKNVRWQQWSLEDRFCGMLSQETTLPLERVVYQLWQRNFRRNLVGAWTHARTLVLQGLGARNLISAPPNFSIVQVAPALASLPAEQTTEPIKRLFGETSAERQPLWAALQGDIQAGINERAQR